MSLINKFTIGFNAEKMKKKNPFDSNNTTLKVNQNNDEPIKQVLSQELVEILINFGFDLKQIMIAFKEYKFTNIDQACFFLMKDNETGKFNHKFFKIEKEENGKYSNLKKGNSCLVCGGEVSDHIDYDISDVRMHINIDQESQKKINSNSSNFSNSIPLTEKNKKIVHENFNNFNAQKSLRKPGEFNNNANRNFRDMNSHILSNKDSSIDKFTNLNTVGNLNNFAMSGNLENMNTNQNFMDNQQNYNENKMFKNIPQQQIISNFEIPPETLDLFDDPDTCKICFSEKITNNNKAEFACGHKFCRKCVSNYLTNSIMDGKVLTIKCLYGGCPKTFVEEEIKMFIGDQLFFKYKKFKITQIKLNNPAKNYVNCPITDCEEIVEFEQNLNEEPLLECDNEHKFCGKCKTPGWHKKGKCNDFISQILKQIQHDNKESDNYKQCPRCSVIIEKNEGCNQMKCINCNLDFCWLCMKRYTDDHYAIYNFRGCPGMRFNSLRKRKIWNNPFLKTFWLILSCFLGILAVFLIIIFFAFFGCAYEFAKCYIEKSYKQEDDEDSNYEYNYELENQVEINRPLTKTDKLVLVILVILGIGCQPIYLMIYLLYALMECYRRFNCWFYYID